MAAVGYYIALPFLYLVSILPFPLLYLLSDFFYFIIYTVAGYRKGIVLTNLRNSFPDKTEAEITQLSKDYYHYLCDITLETFKTLTISKEKMLKHCEFDESALNIFKNLSDQNKSAILTMGHLGNWEWAGNSFSLLCPQQLFVIYHPLTNKYFDGLIYRMRTRFGTGLIPMNSVFKDMLRNRSKTTVTAFISDQTPSPENAHWMTFLNQETPVFKGTEVIAKKLDYPVVYATIKRTGRGYYKVFAEVLVEHPKETKEDYITELHTRRLEQDIINWPEIWIWSHRRWKHKRNKQ